MNLFALVDTIIKHRPIDSHEIQDPSEKFALPKGSQLLINWHKPAPSNHWEFELKTKHGDFFNWFAYRPHVFVDGQPLMGQDSDIGPQRKAFLDMISVPEGTDGPDGYRTMFTGKLFSDFSDHPRKLQGPPNLRSDAAGRYQFLSTTWDECARALDLHDFSPPNQDRAAIFLIKRAGALGHVDAGRVHQACDICSFIWASLPPGQFGQPSITFSKAEELFQRFGGVLG